MIKHPRNLLLNQLYSDIELKKQNHLQNNFECRNVSNIIAELFYITANAFASQSFYSLSNFYINLAKYLNQNFYAYNTLLAENFVRIENYQKAKKIYLLLNNFGEYYSWHSSKQIALLDIEKSKNRKALKFKKSYNNLNTPNVYQTYDFAQFLKNNEKFEQSIKFYSKCIKTYPKSHELYPKQKMGENSV